MSTIFTEDEERLLQHTIEIRHKLINKLTLDGTDIPDKNGDKILLSTLLDGLDKSIHTKAKLTIEDKQAQQQEEITSMIGSLLSNIDPKKYVANNTTNNSNLELPKDLNIKILPGEIETSSVVSYDSFYKTED